MVEMEGAEGSRISAACASSAGLRDEDRLDLAAPPDNCLRATSRTPRISVGSSMKVAVTVVFTDAL